MGVKKYILLLPIVVLVLACHRSVPPVGVLSSAEMVDFLTDAYLAEGLYAVQTNYKYDSLPSDSEGMYAAILRQKGLTRQQVEASMAYYAAHPEQYAAVQEAVEDRLESLSH